MTIYYMHINGCCLRVGFWWQRQLQLAVA